MRAEDRAAATIERLEAQRGDVAQRSRRAAADLDEASRDAARADAAHAALPDGSAMRERVGLLQREAEVRRAAAAQARA
ncbi:hypothetical protein ABTE37_19635, partial [Acinetobacter baumannii]